MSRMQRPLLRPLQSLTSRRLNAIGRRTLVPAPKQGSGPVMERRADRALPEGTSHPWLKTFPIFVVVLTASALGLFNYQKSSSSVVSSTLYSLRIHPKAREILGDEIYFKHKMPWIWGEMNQLHGRINIQYSVKGTKGTGVMRFKCTRRGRGSKYRTEDWSLETPDGQIVQLLEGDVADPYSPPGGLESQ